MRGLWRISLLNYALLVVLLLTLLTCHTHFWDTSAADSSELYASEDSKLIVERKLAGDVSNDRIPAERSGTKLILAYTPFYGRPFNVSSIGRTQFEIRVLPDPMSACAYRCRWTTNPRKVSTADALLFHLYNYNGNRDFRIHDLPPRTDAWQTWILMAREPSSFYHPHQLRQLDDLFNLTLTYQRDSDVQIPYGGYRPLSLSQRAKMAQKELDYMTGKTKMAAWVVSNCKTSSRREEYVRQLQRYVPVDVYGRCGNLTAPVDSANGFREILARDYMFYIAFENSDCDDYISEKFWNSLHIGLIPIVRGIRSNYRKLAPPNSYIQVELFHTPERLAAHLKEISTDRKLFHQYHQWRRLYDANYKFFTTNKNWMCDLCERVHTSPRKTVSISEHFGEDSRCQPYTSGSTGDRKGENIQDLTV